VSEKMTLEEVNRLGREEFVSRLGSVFESSPWVAERAWGSRPFGSFSELHGAMVEAVDEASEERRMDLIRAHPDLAGRAAVAGELTPESTSEQASAGLDRLTPEEYEAFTKMNTNYRERFGFPMIVCVREHTKMPSTAYEIPTLTKESILRNAKDRLKNSREEEVEVALGEIAKIARLRLMELVEADEAPRENRARR
jgi:2-oxo-4-hydroxy-4-carboxy-5-ureidoimidazoline decarboxylase